MVDACLASGVRRLVNTSSPSAAHWLRGLRGSDEQQWLSDHTSSGVTDPKGLVKSTLNLQDDAGSFRGATLSRDGIATVSIFNEGTLTEFDWDESVAPTKVVAPKSVAEPVFRGNISQTAQESAGPDGVATSADVVVVNCLAEI